MADLGGVFDSTDVPVAGDRTPIPAGEYRCCCVKREWKENNTLKNGCLKLTIKPKQKLVPNFFRTNDPQYDSAVSEATAVVDIVDFNNFSLSELKLWLEPV